MSSVVYQLPSTSTGWIAAPLTARRQVPASYVVWNDGTNYRADGMTGAADYSGTDASTIINNAITAAPVGSKVFIKNGTYLLNTNLTPKTGLTIEGESSSGAILKANAANLKLISMAASLPQNSVRVMKLGFDSASLAGITGVDFNQTNNEINQTTQNNLAQDLQFFRNFTTLVDMTGCEASAMDLIWADNTTCLAGDVFAKTFNGDITVSRLIWPQPAGTTAALHVMGQQVKIYNSVLNQIVVENQVANSTTYTATNIITVRDSFLANGQPANTPKIINNGNQTNTVNSLNLDGVDVGLASTGSLFAATGTGSLTVRVGKFTNCSFNVLDSTACKWVSSPVGSVFSINRLDAWDNSYLSLGTGSLGPGDLTTGGYGQYAFVIPPAGFHWPAGGGFGTGTNSPAVPAGIGAANAVRNRANRPVRIYQTGMAGTHIIDAGPLADGVNGTDTLLGVDPAVIDLDPFAQVYYATTKPSSWVWQGL